MERRISESYYISLYIIQKKKRNKINILYFWEITLKKTQNKQQLKAKKTKNHLEIVFNRRIKQMWTPFLCLIFLTNTLIRTLVSGLCQLIMFKCKTKKNVPKFW